MSRLVIHGEGNEHGPLCRRHKRQLHGPPLLPIHLRRRPESELFGDVRQLIDEDGPAALSEHLRQAQTDLRLLLSKGLAGLNPGPDWASEEAMNNTAVKEVAKRVEMVVDPPWDPSRMSDVARLQLNMF